MSSSPSYTILVHLVMLGWFPICMVLVALFGASRGVVLSMVAGLFVLPNAVYGLSGIPDYDKLMATGAGAFLAALLFDTRRILAFRPRWVDLPVGLFVATPFVSAVANGEMGAWFGLSESFRMFVSWGLPWVLGRIYVSSPEGQRWFVACFVGAVLIYLPLCLWEIKMSPRLHEIVYGIRLKSFKHAIRSLGWRPNVFLEHGLMAAMVIAMAALAAFWSWMTGVKSRVLGMPISLVFLALLGLTLAAQSSGAILMLLTGMGVLTLSRATRTRLPLALLLLLPVAYVGIRYGFQWRGDELVQVADTVFGERRANSLQYRLDNENFLMDRAKLKPWLGWGAIASFTGNTGDSFTAIIDSLWTILVGVYGWAGLVSAFATLLLGGFLVWKRLPVRAWAHPRYATLALFGLIGALYAADCLLNAFPNPLFLAMTGGVAHALGTQEGLRVWSMQGVARGRSRPGWVLHPEEPPPAGVGDAA